MRTPDKQSQPSELDHLINWSAYPELRRKALMTRHYANAKWPLLNFPIKMEVLATILNHPIPDGPIIDYQFGLTLTEQELDEQWRLTVELYGKLGKTPRFDCERLRRLIESHMRSITTLLTTAVGPDLAFENVEALKKFVSDYHTEVKSLEEQRRQYFSSTHNLLKSDISKHGTRVTTASMGEQFRDILKKISPNTRVQNIFSFWM